MTVSTVDNVTNYVGDGIETVFSFSFQAQQDSDMFGLVNLVIDPNTTTQLNADQDTNPGGTVTFGIAPPDGSLVTLLRALPPTQLVDYQEYDPFPAETHEGALDKLTMLNQQLDERVLASLRLPVGDDATVVYPPVVERAEKYSYFDIDGNVTVIDVAPQAAAIQEITIADDSTSVMRVTTSQEGATPINPHIGFNNINKALGALQLNEQGNVPIENLHILGVTIRGPYRGDDLCPKPNDEVGDCNAPDTRNPSQRFTTLIFQNGDAFIINMADGETVGTMELFESVGDLTPQILDVKSSDFILYLIGELGVTEGWYFFPKILELGAADDISYDDSGNTYVLGSNVQIALDATDQTIIDHDQYFLSQRTVGRQAFLAANINVLVASGLYVSDVAADGNPNATDQFTVTHIIRDSDNMSQFAISHTNQQQYSRTFALGLWTAWVVPFDLKYEGYLDTGHHLQYSGSLADIVRNSTFLIFGGSATDIPTDFSAGGLGYVTTFVHQNYPTSPNRTQVLYGDSGNVYKVWMRSGSVAGSFNSAWKLVVGGNSETIDASGNRTFTGNGIFAGGAFITIAQPAAANALTRKDYVDSNPTMFRTGDRLDITNVST